MATNEQKEGVIFSPSHPHPIYCSEAGARIAIKNSWSEKEWKGGTLQSLIPNKCWSPMAPALWRTPTLSRTQFCSLGRNPFIYGSHLKWVLGSCIYLTVYGLLSAYAREPNGVLCLKQLTASLIQTRGFFSSTVLWKTSIGFWFICFPFSLTSQ